MNVKLSFAFISTTVTILSSFALAWAQSTAFTYQGRLTNGGSPANGIYDMQFALFDNLTAGTQIGTTQTINPCQ